MSKNTGEHKAFGHNSAKFLGDTKGNRDLETNRTEGSNGGSGEASKPKTAEKFCGPTKGNSDLPPNRTDGVSMGHGGGPHKAGGKKGY